MHNQYKLMEKNAFAFDLTDFCCEHSGIRFSHISK